MKAQHSLEYNIEMPGYRFNRSPELIFGTPLLCIVCEDPKRNSYPLLKTYDPRVS